MVATVQAIGPVGSTVQGYRHLVDVLVDFGGRTSSTTVAESHQRRKDPLGPRDNDIPAFAFVVIGA